MAKKSSKPRDLNSMAAAIVGQSTDDNDQGDDPYEGKDPAAVDRGRTGGAKGGPARAAKLPSSERSAIARKAALARWRSADDRARVAEESDPRT
jgi:hypothetical protein